MGKSVTTCPYPKEGLRYPKDNDWLKEHWLYGFYEWQNETPH